MTLKELFDTYPITISKMARDLGKSREWLYGIINDRITLTPETRLQHLTKIKDYIHKMGFELCNIDIDEFEESWNAHQQKKANENKDAQPDH